MLEPSQIRAARALFGWRQLRAARALLGLDQEALAEKVGVSDNTIRNMEACGPEPVGGFASTREKVREGLERLGKKVQLLMD
jgi:DNA-binding XRE family transcriptional regulator